MQEKYDIAIVGAGLVGSIQALMLAEVGFNILLLDAAVPNYLLPDLQPDLRMSAITLKSEEILAECNIIDKLGDRFGSIKNIHVWDANGPGEITFESMAIGKNYMGKLVENNFLHSIVINQLDNKKNITIIRPYIINHIIHSEDGLKISGADNKSECKVYNCKIIIGADGANSWLREFLDFKIDTEDYQHSALITTVHTEQPHNNTAYQQFLPSGPIAFLPWRDQHTCSIVWSQPPVDAQYWLNTGSELFNAKLTNYIFSKLGKVLTSDKRVVFPLVMRHVSNYYKNNCILIGDAAHTVHPLAGQGLNLGIYDAKALADVLIWARNKNYKLNSDFVLKKYELQRRGHNQQIINLMNFFKNIYSIENTGIKLLRNLGMNFIDHTGFIKKAITRQAAGYS